METEAAVIARNTVTWRSRRERRRRTFRDCFVTAFLAMTLAGNGASAAEPQSYPRKPISLLVPFPPGAATDAFARVVGRRMSDTLGQQIVVINRDGASGIIGTDAVARAAPDGYTLQIGRAHV